MIAQPQATVLAHDQARDRLNLLEVIFFLSAFIGVLNPPIIKAFSVYDAVIGVLAFMILAGPARMRWVPESLRLAALLLVLAGLVSAFRATYPIEAVTQVIQYAFVFFVQLPVIITLARSRRTLHAALMLFILGSLLLLLLTMFNQVEKGGRVLVFNKDENANALGIPTIFLTPFVLYFALDQWRQRRRSLVLIGGIPVLYVLLWALTASGSRGAAAATVVSVGVFLTFRHGFELGPKVFLRIGAFAVAVVAVGGFIYWTEIPSPTLKERIESTLNPEEEDRVVDERVALDRAGLAAFTDSPLVGTGFDNFKYVAQFYVDEASLHAPHNVFIQFLAQAGVVGAAAFLFVLVRWFVLLLRTQATVGTRSQRELLWAFIAAMTGIITNAIASPLVLHRHYWLLYGLGIMAAVQASSDEERHGWTLVPVRHT